MPLVDTNEEYVILEGWGDTNFGKSYLALSILELIPEGSKKNKVLYLCNEPNYSEAVNEWKARGFLNNIEVYFHTDLEGFEQDIQTIIKKYYKEVENPITHEISRQMPEVFAIIVDEGERLYREGYLARRVKELGHELEPKHYGVPRSKFVNQMTTLAAYPCHFLLVSKVAPEYESYYEYSADGNKKWLRFREVEGEVKYRLPDAFKYVASIRCHLVMREEPQFDDKGKEILDQLGKQLIKRYYYAILEKQKADRDTHVIIELPTVAKIQQRLSQLRTLRIMKEKMEKKKGGK